MRTIAVKCPDELVSKLARLNYELTMHNTVIDRFVDRHLNDTSALDSPTFERIARETAEKTAEYEMMKDKVTNEVLTDLKGHEIEWSLDFYTGDITVKVLCNCDLGEAYD